MEKLVISHCLDFALGHIQIGFGHRRGPEETHSARLDRKLQLVSSLGLIGKIDLDFIDKSERCGFFGGNFLQRLHAEHGPGQRHQFIESRVVMPGAGIGEQAHLVHGVQCERNAVLASCRRIDADQKTQQAQCWPLGQVDEPVDNVNNSDPALNVGSLLSTLSEHR